MVESEGKSVPGKIRMTRLESCHELLSTPFHDVHLLQSALAEGRTQTGDIFCLSVSQFADHTGPAASISCTLPPCCTGEDAATGMPTTLTAGCLSRSRAADGLPRAA